MKKIIIHTEEILKQGAKLQFQIKMPTTTNMVKGILITATELDKGGKSAFVGHVPPTIKMFNPVIGWTWLRIPEKRDVFYAEKVKFSNPLKQDLQGIPEQGFSGKPQWWIGGTKRSFFNVTVPMEDVMIEGFYVDRSAKNFTDYKIKIYLELEINE